MAAGDWEGVKLQSPTKKLRHITPKLITPKVDPLTCIQLQWLPQPAPAPHTASWASP